MNSLLNRYANPLSSLAKLMKKTNQIKDDMKEWLDNDRYKGSSVYEQPPADASLTNSKPEA